LKEPHLLVGLVVDGDDSAFSDGHGDITISHGKGVVAGLGHCNISLGPIVQKADIPVTLGTSAYKPLGEARIGLESSVASRSTMPFFPSFESWAEAVFSPE
jgi:hypothetical protein